MKFNEPTPKYTTQADGTQTIEWLPPTPLMMTAHREMEKMAEVVQGQQRTMTTMQEHINYLEFQVQNLQKVLNDLTPSQPADGHTEHTSSPDSADPSVGESQPA